MQTKNQKVIELRILLPPHAMRKLRQLGKAQDTSPFGIVSLALFKDLFSDTAFKDISIESD